MSDARLRDLERRWRASGALEDEVAFLREALRSGALEREALHLAAYCRSEAAARVLDVPMGSPELDVWAAGLLPWGKVALVEAALALAELTLPLWAFCFPRDARMQDAIAATQAWLRCPCAVHVEQAYLASVVAEEAQGLSPEGLFHLELSSMHAEAWEATNLVTGAALAAHIAAGLAGDDPEAYGATHGLSILARQGPRRSPNPTPAELELLERARYELRSESELLEVCARAVRQSALSSALRGG